MEFDGGLFRARRDVIGVLPPEYPDRHLALGKLGALGHSQGAGGALNAMIDSTAPILTAVPIELPSSVSGQESIAGFYAAVPAGVAHRSIAR